MSGSDDATPTEWRPLSRIAWSVTVGFAAVSAVVHAAADRLDLVYAVACSLTFALGIGLFMLGFWNGVQRSRVEEVTLPGLMAISRSHVPVRLRNTLWAAVILQIVIAVVAGSLRPFTQQAFALLVPMFGIGLAALVGSRSAEFFPRRSS